MRTQVLMVKNTLGLHTRVCSQLVDCAHRYQSQIHLSHHGHSVDMKRIIDLMSLGAGLGASLTLTVQGPDEDQAFEAIVALFDQGFGEDISI